MVKSDLAGELLAEHDGLEEQSAATRARALASAAVVVVGDDALRARPHMLAPNARRGRGRGAHLACLGTIHRF